MSVTTLREPLLSFSELREKYEETFKKIADHYRILYKEEFFGEELETAIRFKKWAERMLGVEIIYEYNQATRRADLFIIKDGEYLNYGDGYGYYEYEPHIRMFNFLLPKLGF